MKALVAGFGNIFFGDDAYGNEVARLLSAQPWPPEVRVVDFGIRGMHVAFDMLNGYDLVIFIDAVSRGGAPGTLYIIEPEELAGTTPDAHAMELHSALAFYNGLARDLRASKLPKIVVIGCEPESVEEGIGISATVAAAVPATLPLIQKVLEQHGIAVPQQRGIGVNNYASH